MLNTAKNAVSVTLIASLSTGLSILISFLGVGNESVIMVFLLAVLMTAVLTSSRGWSICAALFSALLFNFLFTQPKYSFFMYDTNDLMLLIFFLITGIIAGTVTSRLQNEMQIAGQNEQTAKIMYQVSSAFLSASGKEGVVKKAKDLIKKYAGIECEIMLGSKETTDGFEIRSGSGTLGRLMLSERDPNGQQLLIVQAICTQLGIALERENLVADREKIRLAMEREQQRSMFLRSVAHDLRSPLTAISGAGNLLADNYDDLTNSERRKLASDISEEIVWLTDLVENILSMTRISEQKIVLHKQDEVIDDIVGEAVKHTERLLKDRRVEVKLPDEVVTVPMDGKLIAQVIINLLENAARHTPPSSSIKLTVVAEDCLKVSVADTGYGIPEAIRPHLFERFVTQEDEVIDGRRGLGLGLAICLAIVQAHGGEIHVEDNVPTGSVFIFTLPMEESR
ncbi:MAG: ATP-binding protein [Clostridiaceae bacterium]|nr:ATP-binding protein [Clostridiaceae bacterium]